MRLHVLVPVPLQLLHPRPDRFAIRAQSALTSISHISDLGSLNTSTNHHSPFSSGRQLLFAIHDSSSHSKHSCFLIRVNRCHVGRAAETSQFPTHHRSFRSHTHNPRHPPFALVCLSVVRFCSNHRLKQRAEAHDCYRGGDIFCAQIRVDTALYVEGIYLLHPTSHAVCRPFAAKE